MVFPKLVSIEISDFSLYKSKDLIHVDFSDGVFCLVGANGLGKSTFISILTYGITGIVINPNRDFSQSNSIVEFVSDNREFSKNFFRGRIDPSKYDQALVRVVFSINGDQYTVERSFKDQTGLRFFSRRPATMMDEIKPSGITPKEIREEYESCIVKDMGLNSFEQFIFLHYFLLTFDESRRLLFWDRDSMSRVMYFCFGIDPIKAERADQLRKLIKSHESNIRNDQWSISKKQKELNSINEDGIEIDISKGIALESQLNTLDKRVDGYVAREEKLQHELKDCELRLSDYAITLQTQKSEFDATFRSLYDEDVPIENDKNVVETLREISRLILQGKTWDWMLEQLKEAIIEATNRISKSNSQEKLSLLAELDASMSNINSRIKEKSELKLDLLAEQTNLHKELSMAREQRRDLLEKDGPFIESYRKAINPDVQRTVDSLRSEIDRLANRKNQYILEKEQFEEELKVIDQEMGERYKLAESVFLPAFKRYAKSFVGYDIDVSFSTLEKTVGLTLSMNGALRQEHFQLSESQRYFIDIALRFALCEYCTKGCPAYILVDTPEGSLDIAYESKAGKMFADFVSKGNDLIMTANINSSQLLLQLAEKCRRGKMKVERMIDWTALSSVQQEEQDKIEEAYSIIEKHLNGNA